jgi:hypothetical protein
LVLLFYSGVPNEHVKQANSKTPVQLWTFIIVPHGSLGFTTNNVASPDAPLVELLLQCYFHLQTVSHSNGCSSLRIRPKTYGMKSGEQRGYCTTSCLHCQRIFLTVSTEWPVALSWQHLSQFPILLPKRTT